VLINKTVIFLSPSLDVLIVDYSSVIHSCRRRLRVPRFIISTEINIGLLDSKVELYTTREMRFSRRCKQFIFCDASRFKTAITV
jgi:hypothetical protein